MRPRDGVIFFVEIEDLVPRVGIDVEIGSRQMLFDAGERPVERVKTGVGSGLHDGFGGAEQIQFDVLTVSCAQLLARQCALAVFGVTYKHKRSQNNQRQYITA